ncbi:GNAT family N-acetyltransferase [Candidatus Micrarchaeota archaeon]|nr:GNAT family N-acetyltransferase [Candidatus Micrarchaeota archaeon]
MLNVRLAQPCEHDDAKDFIQSIFPDASVFISDEDTLLLAEFQGEKVGFAHLIDGGERFILQGFGVDKSMRGRGVGTMLMEHLLDIVDDKPLFLKVKVMNPAVDLYARYGFFLKKFGQINVLVKKPNN